MPYFKWKGIDLTGCTQRGTMRARSEHHVYRALLNNDIALLRSSIKHKRRILNASSKADFFRQLALLIDSGVFLDQALLLLQEQVKKNRAHEMFDDIIADVHEGHSLSEACKKYPYEFDSLTIQMMQAGHESGSLGRSLQMLADYSEMREQFYKKLRSAALLPTITLIFFFIIGAAIIIFIVPAFASMFASLGHDLPTTTRWMMTLHSILTGWMIVGIIMVLILAIIGFRKLYHYIRAKRIIDAYILRIPFIGTLVRETTITYFFQSVALLIQGGIRVVPALRTVRSLLGNEYIKEHLIVVEREVDKGYSLSTVMKNSKNLFVSDAVALIRVGEESGQLGLMLARSAALYQERINRILFFMSTVFQPILMIILGLLIMGLIFAVYIPIFNLSYVVA